MEIDTKTPNKETPYLNTGISSKHLVMMKNMKHGTKDQGIDEPKEEYK